MRPSAQKQTPSAATRPAGRENKQPTKRKDGGQTSTGPKPFQADSPEHLKRLRDEIINLVKPQSIKV